MKKTKPCPLVLSFADYQRLYRVIATVLNSVNAHTAHACKFFAIAGSYIISESHGLNARPVCGSAFYRLDDSTDFVMAFTDMEAFQQQELHSHSEAFHAWIECNGVVIDLLAPLFREALLALKPDSPLRLPRKMFQRHLAEMAESPLGLTQEGDFFLAANPSLTNEMIQNFTSKNANSDLVMVCKHWYKPNPKSMLPQLMMSSDDGTETLMKLDNTELVGKW